MLDFAVAALAMVVVGSLFLLAWTLAVGAVRATSTGRRRITSLRSSVTDAEARIRSLAATGDRRDR
jgi:hypothetical protein